MYGKITLNSLNPRQASSEFQSLSTLNRITCFSSSESKLKDGNCCFLTCLPFKQQITEWFGPGVFMINYNQHKT